MGDTPPNKPKVTAKIFGSIIDLPLTLKFWVANGTTRSFGENITSAPLQNKKLGHPELGVCPYVCLNDIQRLIQ